MHIVIVDPISAALDCIGRLLEARHYKACCFTDGREALSYIASNPTIDAVIISSEQTCGSGIELCWQTRLLASYYRPIYVILLSSHDGKRTLVEALDSGADDFISKPPDADELYAKLRAAERTTSMQRELVCLATTDPLTGLLNRRSFFERSTEACARATPDFPLSTILMDIDHFKKVNDTFGHVVGDEVIKAVAAEAAKASRITGRLGGEEFAILIEAEMSCADRAAECIRACIARLKVEAAGRSVHVTASFGISEWQCGDTIDDMLHRADMALYAAKAAGRDQVLTDHPRLWVIADDQHRSAIRGSSRTAAKTASEGAKRTPGSAAMEWAGQAITLTK
jgi:diguanylate cyclase (GGDEF)-like protein